MWSSRARSRTRRLDKGTRIPGSSHQSRGFREPLDASAWTIPPGRTPDWSMPFTLGAPLGPAAGIRLPEPGAQVDQEPIEDEVAATLAPPPATHRVTDDPATEPRVPEPTRRRTPIVPAARRSTSPPSRAVRAPRTTLDYPLSEPALWPDAFDPDYG